MRQKPWADPNQVGLQGEIFPTSLLSNACLCIKLIKHEGKSTVDFLVFQIFYWLEQIIIKLAIEVTLVCCVKLMSNR